MDTPQKANSTSNGALWVIACSLAVIAGCLVLFVTRQGCQFGDKIDDKQVVGAAKDKSTETVRLPKAFSVSPARARFTEESPAPQPTITIVETAPPEPAVAPTPVIEPIVSNGLAPLTELKTTNSVTIIMGRVTLEGKPPAENPIAFDPLCGKLNKGKTNTTRFYVVSKDGGLADVFVRIKSGLEGKRFPAPGTPVVLDQTGCLYAPYVLGLMANQKLRIRNSDPFMHNVHIDPGVDGGNVRTAKNIAQGPRAPDVITSFPAREDFLKIRCDIHPSMYAYVCVVNNPFFAVTDANGNFAISNVPPGNYVLEALHRKAHGSRGGEFEKIEVVAGETTTANFTIKVPPANATIARTR